MGLFQQLKKMVLPLPAVALAVRLLSVVCLGSIKFLAHQQSLNFPFVSPFPFPSLPFLSPSPTFPSPSPSPPPTSHPPFQHLNNPPFSSTNPTQPNPLYIFPTKKKTVYKNMLN